VLGYLRYFIGSEENSLKSNSQGGNMENINQQALLKAIEIEDPIISIKTYLEMVSEYDSHLKNALISIDKSYEKCWEYIQKKAKEHLNSKSGNIPPSIIYGWSIHYFIEKNE